MANLTRAHLGIKFPSGQHSHEELLWESKFEIIANTVMSSHFRILLYARPRRLTFLASFSWGTWNGGRGDELPLDVDDLLDGRQSGWRLAPETEVSLYFTSRCPRGPWHASRECGLWKRNVWETPSHPYLEGCCASQALWVRDCPRDRPLLGQTPHAAL